MLEQFTYSHMIISSQNTSICFWHFEKKTKNIYMIFIAILSKKCILIVYILYSIYITLIVYMLYTAYIKLKFTYLCTVSEWSLCNLKKSHLSCFAIYSSCISFHYKTWKVYINIFHIHANKQNQSCSAIRLIFLPYLTHTLSSSYKEQYLYQAVKYYYK